MKQETMDKILRTVAWTLAALVFTAILVVGISSATHTTEKQEQPSETAPGMPLDAIQYAAPEWAPNARQCFRVTDRQSGSSWWVIDMHTHADNQWVVLPIGQVQSNG